MCGLAGRMAMELGLHSLEASQFDQQSSEWQQELVTLSCTLLVLDRQWSAATGYPSNFKETDFEMAKVSLVITTGFCPTTPQTDNINNGSRHIRPT